MVSNKEMEAGLTGVQGLVLPHRPVKEGYVASSFQFLLPEWSAEQIGELVSRCARRGVELKWFGGAEPQGFTSRYDSWRYTEVQSLPQTDRVLRGLLDMRLPLTFSAGDVALIARIIRSEVVALTGR